VVREVVRHYRQKGPTAAGVDDRIMDWRPPVARARALLSDADRLAAEGHFAEAVHLLLFRSIEDLDAKRPHAVKPALTSRDILDLTGLPAMARKALSRLVATVEWSFFGGRPVEAQDFAACRRAYEEFAFPDAWTERPAWASRPRNLPHPVRCFRPWSLSLSSPSARCRCCSISC